MAACLKPKPEGLFCNRSEFSHLSRLQKACLTALWSYDTLISSFMKLATSPLTHKPIRANPIRRMRGRDEIGLFNSLYRNMLMQDNDSLIACYYGMYWRPNMRAVTAMIVWYMKMQTGPLRRAKDFNFYCKVQCCLGTSIQVGKIRIDVLHCCH